ncbi:hypothetical protein [Burkholderia cenocepacia]|uniref:hypothetical protein n=1 Tax=Burkholderia cenocepacia TaxID=95486 RepID=UPI001BA18526|nr:hypothetical protein [Burkholderia cenocepacia]MBR7905821.1 hypothetical protein [Burkholderia cenocepacia]MBR8426611.1 hypothetical protein [Burkholderia cenocepacia]
MFNYFSQQYKNPEEDLFDKPRKINKLAELNDEILDIEIELENLRYRQSNLIDLMSHVHTADYIDYDIADKFIKELSKKICVINEEISELSKKHTSILIEQTNKKITSYYEYQK